MNISNLSPLIEIDKKLGLKTVVYRIVDFFSAAEIVNNNRLMFSRADVFQDKNEGVERLLAQLQSSGPYEQCALGWNDQETANKYHTKYKKSFYISSWSTNPESVSMWSLYSPDLMSVRISTTIEKLHLCANNFIDQYSITKLQKKDLGNDVIVAVNGHISSVKYTNLENITKTITRRFKAKNRIIDRYKRKGMKIPAPLKATPRYWEREKQRRLELTKFPFNLKDEGFKHEDEVRVVLRLGEVECTYRILQLREYINPEHLYNKPLQSEFTYFKLIENGQIPEREFITCPTSFVESVAIDPRCPKHKSRFMTSWFKKHKIEVVESRSFGYLPS